MRELKSMAFIHIDWELEETQSPNLAFFFLDGVAHIVQKTLHCPRDRA